ncbi:MAG: O-antigen ligase family protein [Phocaeicola sp.]|nr:O-antigen ligase family protein [Phocaeicola sp.]
MIRILRNELKILRGQKLYLFLILMTILRKTIFNRTRDMNDFAAVDANNSIAIVATLIMLVIVLTKYKNILNEIRMSFSFLLYYLFAALSVTWAGFQFIAVAGYKVIEVIVSFLMIMIIMKNLKTTINNLFFILITCSSCNIIYFIQSLKNGIFHDNAFPILGLVELFLVMGMMRYKIVKWKYVQHHAIIGFLTLALSTSTASWISFIFGAFVFFSSGYKGINIPRIIGAILLFSIIYLAFGDFVKEVVYAGKSEEQFQNASGREALWTAYIKGWLESPIIGHGFIVGEKGAVAAKYMAFATNTAHNMIISVLVNTGLIGLGLWIFFMWKQCKICLKYSYRKNKYALTCFPVIVAMLVNANSFPIIGSEWSPTSVPIYALIIFVFVYIPLSQSEFQIVKK